MFSKFPVDVIGYVSKQHFTITAEQVSGSKAKKVAAARRQTSSSSSSSGSSSSSDADSEAAGGSENEVFGTALDTLQVPQVEPPRWEFHIVDTSTNGTFLNDKKLTKNKKCKIKNKDQIGVVKINESLKVGFKVIINQIN